jgi:hypothetical protein
LCSRLGAQQPATFFDPDNEEGKKARLHMAIAALDDMVEWLIEGGVVGIYDATNSTEARRYFWTQQKIQIPHTFDNSFLSFFVVDWFFLV